MLPSRDAAAELYQGKARVGEVALHHVIGDVGVGDAQRGRYLQQRPVLERLIGRAAVGRLAHGDILTGVQPHDLAGAYFDTGWSVLVLGRGKGVLRRGRGHEHRIHRRDLFAVELGIVVLIEQEQFHDGGGQFRHPAQLAALDRVDDMDHFRGGNADDLARQPRIGAVAWMAAQEVIGDAAADPVEFDALTDDVAVRCRPGLFQRQHLGRQHLQLQGHAQPIARAAHPDPEEHLACHEHLTGGAALEPVEIGESLRVCIVGPGEPEALQLFLARGIHDFRDRLDPVADGVGGPAFDRIHRIAVVAHKPAGAGGDVGTSGCNQRVDMRARRAEPAQAPVVLAGVEPTDEGPEALPPVHCAAHHRSFTAYGRSTRPAPRSSLAMRRSISPIAAASSASEP